MKKKERSTFIAKISAILVFVVAIFLGGYFFLDKVIVPKYFGNYGIYDIGDLIGVVTSLYSSPKESELVTNGYSQIDLSSAIVKLQDANYKIKDDGTILKQDFDSFKGDGKVELTDREFASVCQKLIENGMLSSTLPNLNYLNVLNITVLELIATPYEDSLDEASKTYNSANIRLVIKIDTTDLRVQIAEQMNTPMYLLKIIIPDTLYFTVDYDIDLEATEDERTSGKVYINGKKEKQSETLINLLIEFIFPKEDNMDIEGFTRALGDVVLKGIDALGEFKFISGIGVENSNGIVVN